jgi:hypothetical protein
LLMIVRSFHSIISLNKIGYDVDVGDILIPFEKIAIKCSERIKKWSLGDPQFGDPRYFPKKLALNNFTEILPVEGDQRVCFVDGGNTEILNTPGFVVHLTRVGYCIYRDTVKVHEDTVPSSIDFFTLAFAEQKGREIYYSIEVIPTSEKFQHLLPDAQDMLFDSFDRTLMDGQHRAPLTKVANMSREFIEWKLAEELCRSVLDEGDLLIRDGSLQTSVTGESKYANKAYEAALRKKVLFSGLAKTSSLFTDSGMPLFSAVSLMANRNELNNKRWYYQPIVDIKAPDHKAVMLAVKLHPRSKHVFRFEILNSQAEEMQDFNTVVGLLAKNASDLTFPGYPYGLIEADRLARVRDEEVEPFRIQLLSALSRLGSWRELEAFIHATDAHNVIDEI